MDAELVRFGSGHRYRDPDGPVGLALEEAGRLAEGLRAARSDPKVRTVVAVTHAPPVRRALVPADDPMSVCSGWFFSSALEALLDDPFGRPDVWVFGHTHFGHDFEDRGCRFVAHPYGYPEERRGNPAPRRVSV